MTFLPMVERELRGAARRPWTHRVRFLAALSVIVMGGAVLLGNQRGISPSHLGTLLFHVSSVFGFVLVLLSGSFLTADCLCSEKRDGTLGLLFLTDLKGYDVVLGKLAATSLVSFYALLAIVPMLGLPLLMGGVSLGQFLRTVLALLDTLFLSLAAGMLASAICRDTREAMFLSLGQMIFLTGVLYLLAVAADAIFKGNSLNVLLMLPSPLLAFAQAGNPIPSRALGLAPYWASSATVGGLALLQLSLAIWILPRSWQEKNLSRRPTRRQAPRWRRLASRLAVNPFFWLATRDKFPGRGRSWLFGLLLAAWSLFYVAALTLPNAAGSGKYLVICLFMAYGMHIIVKILVAVQASLRLCEDLRNGALELLLVTPVTPEKILDGQRRALKVQFQGLLLSLWAMNFLLFWCFAIVNPVGIGSEMRWLFALFCAGGALLLPVDFNALGWVGMAEAMAGRRHHRAVLVALAKILLPPILLTWAFVFFLAGGIGSGTVNVIHFFWLTAGLVTSCTVGSRAKALLRGQFRNLASGQQANHLKGKSVPGLYWVAEPTATPPS